jgi:endoglucanase
MDWIEILRSLTGVHAPPGHEARATALARELLEPHMDEVSCDAMGNIVAVRRCGKPGARRLLLDAHIDEVGLVVTGHAGDGFLRFTGLGGLDERILPASDVLILTDPPAFAVVDTLPPHLQKDSDADHVASTDELYLDSGLPGSEAEALVPVGTPAVLISELTRLGERQVSAKALDNRASVAVIIGALELLAGAPPTDVDLYVLLSAQEEVGTRGAQTAAFAIEPDWCVVVDVDFARQPGAPPELDRVLGGGVVIARGPNMDRQLTQLAIDTAREKGVPYQISVEPGGNSGTNAHTIQVSRSGVRTALLGVPVRNMHTPVETADLRDFDAAAILISELARRCGRDA